MIDFDNFILSLKNSLNDKLPGKDVQYKMAPKIRLNMLKYGFKNTNPKLSSVLILLIKKGNNIFFPLIVRADYKGIHSGQISLPGGKKEITDTDLIYTALREANEEIGVEINKIIVLGKLTELYIPPSNFFVQPVLAYIEENPELVSDYHEVKEIIYADLNKLVSLGSEQKKKINMRYGIKMNVPCYVVDNHVIWGATAMILSEFIEISRKLLNTN